MISWTVLGVMLGYPDCCIADFLNRITGNSVKITKRKLYGTGFVPCEHCNRTKSEKELINEINANRKIKQRFPNAPNSILKNIKIEVKNEIS